MHKKRSGRSASGMSTCRTVRLEEIRGDFLKKELCARTRRRGVQLDAEDAEVERVADSADDEKVGKVKEREREITSGRD